MYYTDKKVYQFISQQAADPILERRTCSISGHEFPIYQSDHDFYTKISPTVAGQSFQIPYPTICPEERTRRRMLFRNERKLYKQTCALTHKPMITIYAPDVPTGATQLPVVYDQQVRWSDQRNAANYAQKIDWQQSCTAQVQSLQAVVPRLAIFNQNVHNAAYTNQSYDNHNCYLGFAIADCQDCAYLSCATHNTDCLDLAYTQHSTNSYQCVDAMKVYNCYRLNACTDCSYCVGCQDCHQCDHCIGCIGLSNKKYHINNQPSTAAAYEQAKKERLSSTKQRGQTGAQQRPATYNTSIHNSYGNKLAQATDCILCYDAHEIQSCHYSARIFTSTDCFDCYGMGASQLVAEGIGVERIQHSFANTVVSDSSYMFYCDLCFSCTHCFGCVGLRNASHCIFNRQYTKQEYEKTLARLITHMTETGERGEFFHSSLSPFSYNETVAQEYFPLTREQALARGYKRQDHDYPINIPDGTDTIQAADLHLYEDYLAVPISSSSSVHPLSSDKLLSSAIICSISGRPFRITKAELVFYHKHQLPLPRTHPDLRHQQRLSHRSPRALYFRNCDDTQQDILSVYPHNAPFAIWDADIYKQHMHG